MLMLPAIRLFDNTKDLTAAIDMFNRNPQPSQFTIIGLVFLAQGMLLGPLPGCETVRVEFRQPLIARIGIFLESVMHSQMAALQEREIMHSAFSTDHHEDLQCLQTHNELGFNGMSFFFPE